MRNDTAEHTLLSLDNVVTKSASPFHHPLSLQMKGNEHWIIYGNNASGKTFLVKTIMSSFLLLKGKITYDFFPSSSQRISENVLYLTFHDQYSNQTGSLYQLRWNQGLLGELESDGLGLPMVKDVLDTGNLQNEPMLRIMEEKLNIRDLMEKHIVSLSSGEFRRFQIAQIVLKNPRLIIIENPFIGLDEDNRKQVSDFLHSIIEELPIQIIIVVCRIPKNTEGFTHFIHVKDGLIEKIPVSSVFMAKMEATKLSENDKKRISEGFQTFSYTENDTDRSEESNDAILQLNHVNIKYGDTTILKDLDWEVRQGEKWALQGKNGAGKSTLLSIVCADNPQSYSCDVSLFGHRRGSGESIWDIKKNIGYISPEMFRSYRKPMPVENIVASGLYDTIGLFKKLKEEDFEKITTWLRIFDLDKKRMRNYLELSDGEQRLVLLARAFVKNPLLLILDEPFHGIDAENRLMVKEIIEQYCLQKDKTLIMVSHYEEDFPQCITNHKTLIKN